MNEPMKKGKNDIDILVDDIDINKVIETICKEKNIEIDTTRDGNQEGHYRYTPCPICNKGNHFTTFYGTNGIMRFSTHGACDVDTKDSEGGNSYTLLKAMGYTHDESMTRLKAYAKDDNYKKKEKEQKEGGYQSNYFDTTLSLEKRRKEYLKDLRRYHKEHEKEPINPLGIYNELSDKLMIDHLKDRGLNPDTVISKYKLSYADNVITLPITYNGAEIERMVRYIKPIGDKKYGHTAGTKKEFCYLGLDKLIQQIDNKRVDKPPFIVVEGYFDWLVLDMLGYNAIATLGDPSNLGILIEILGLKDKVNILWAMDNDQAGEQFAKKLQAMGYTHFFEYPEGADYKDISDLYKNLGHDMTKDSIEHYIGTMKGKPIVNLKEYQKEETKRTEPVQEPAKKEGAKIQSNMMIALDYIDNLLDDDIQLNRNLGKKDTGINIIDKNLDGGLLPGMYVLGGGTSVGKTTLSLQIADYRASQGDKVLYIPLEQTKKELITKSLARLINIYKIYGEYKRPKGDDIKNLKNPISGIDILFGDFERDNNYYKALEHYKQHIASNITYLDGNLDTDIQTIIRAIEEFTSLYKDNNTFIIVDYLQAVRPVRPNMTDKQAIEEVIRRLNHVTNSKGITTLCISSFNRSGYDKAELESFKESGYIDYSFLGVFALKVKNKKEIKGKNINKLENRNISFVCLKNRYGKRDWDKSFAYYPAIELFL